MSATGKRVFWNDAEKTLLAERMAAYIATHPEASLLHAVREAQLHLPEDRRREIVTWTIVAGALQPLLLAAQESLASKEKEATPSGTLSNTGADTSAFSDPLRLKAPADGTTPRSSGSEDCTATPLHEEPKHPGTVLGLGQAQQSSELLSEEAAASQPRAKPGAGLFPTPGVSLDPLQVEAALLAAFTSPVVERALVDLFGRAMSQAFSRLSPGNAAAESLDRETPSVSNGRVLLAGFSAADTQLLSTALASHFEVRVWKPMQSPQLFETLAKMCAVVVVPDEMGEDVDEAVSAMGSRLVRFQGSTARAVERVHAMMTP